MTKKILYGVGILIVFLMVLGLAINYIGKWIGVEKPLNSLTILITFWFSVLAVVIINKQRIYNWIKSWHKPSMPKSVYALIILPILAVVGAELVNYTGSNVLLMVVYPLLVIIPIICMFTKLIPKNYWGFAVWMMALSVLLSRALITPYLSGADNIQELNCCRSVYNLS